MPEDKDITLEGILADKHLIRVLLSEPEYYAVRQEALQSGAALGWEVVAVDFSDPGNLYALPYRERQELIKRYWAVNTLFFHDNIAGGTLDMVAAARGHMEELVHKFRNGAPHNRFFATFSNIPEEAKHKLNDPLCSSYFTLWGRRLTGEKGQYVLEQEESIEGVLRGLLQGGGKGAVVNVVGAELSGKTSLLIALERRLSFGYAVPGEHIRPSYVTMQSLTGENPRRQFEEISRRSTDSRVALIDEADMVTPALHRMLAREYRVIVYASHRELSEFSPAAVLRMHFPGGERSPV